MARIIVVILCLLASGIMAFPTAPMSAEEPVSNGQVRRFKIDSRTVVGDRVVKNVTIFYDGLVYDFIGEHGQITIYDKTAGTFTLLDPSSRLKTQVTVQELTDHFATCKESLRKSDNPLHNYLAEPYFEENSYEAESGLMYFRSPWIEYRFETVVLGDPVVSELYYDYCTQSTLLNIRTSGVPTTMIRYVLNPIIEKNQRFPGKVHMTFYPKGKVLLARTVIEAESTHTFVRRLQSTDEAKIKQQAKRHLELFRQVPLDEYLRTVSE